MGCFKNAGMGNQSVSPYHFWLEETNQIDPKISNQCETFGDWLYSILLILEAIPKYSIQDSSKIYYTNKSDKCLLIMVIDNFNFKFADLITALIEMLDLA